MFVHLSHVCANVIRLKWFCTRCIKLISFHNHPYPFIPFSLPSSFSFFSPLPSLSLLPFPYFSLPYPLPFFSLPFPSLIFFPNSLILQLYTPAHTKLIDFCIAKGTLERIRRLAIVLLVLLNVYLSLSFWPLIWKLKVFPNWDFSLARHLKGLGTWMDLKDICYLLRILIDVDKDDQLKQVL